MPTSILGNVFNSAYGILNPFLTKPLFSTTICVIMTLISAPLPSPGSRLKTLLRELSAPHLVIPSKTTRVQAEPVEASHSFTNPLYRLSKLPLAKKTSFQFAEYTIFSDLRSGADKIKLLVIYRPPYSTAHRVTVATFLDEFANYLEPIILSPEPLVIAGDMNIHVDDPVDSDAIKFLDLLDTYGLTQHVNTPTHRLATGIYIDDWKRARVTPIFKSGDRRQCANYRPISILPAVSKVFEKEVFRQVYG